MLTGAGSADGMSEFSSTAADTGPGWQVPSTHRSVSDRSLRYSLDEASRQPSQPGRYSLDEAARKVAESSPSSGPPVGALHPPVPLTTLQTTGPACWPPGNGDWATL